MKRRCTGSIDKVARISVKNSTKGFNSMSWRTLMSCLAVIVFIFLTGCVPPFSSMQSARLAGKGKFEVSPFFSTVSFSAEGESEHAQNEFGLQGAYLVERAPSFHERVVDVEPRVVALPSQLLAVADKLPPNSVPGDYSAVLLRKHRSRGRVYKLSEVRHPASLLKCPGRAEPVSHREEVARFVALGQVPKQQLMRGPVECFWGAEHGPRNVDRPRPVD